jgi:hypothetical protein
MESFPPPAGRLALRDRLRRLVDDTQRTCDLYWPNLIRSKPRMAEIEIDHQ